MMQDRNTSGRLTRMVTRSWPYAAWAGLVVLALVTTYFGDPYVFAFTTLGLTGVSAPIGLVGACVALFSRIAAREKASIVTCIAIAAVALALAFVVLRTFRWA